MNNNPIDKSLTEYAALVGLVWGHETQAIALQMAGGTIETLSLQQGEGVAAPGASEVF
jgi:hypothetical protein